MSIMRDQLESPEPRRAPRLPRVLQFATLAVWLLWLSTIVLLWVQHRMGVLHPHFLPLTLLLVGSVFATVLATSAGLWRGVMGPRRVRNLVLLGVALVPVILTSAVAFYVSWRFARHKLDPNDWVMKIAKVGAASLMDVHARYRYPNRVETERLVMFYDSLEDPQRDAQAMDRHLAELERVLGRRLRGRIYWSRGPLLWFDRLTGGIELLSWATGSTGPQGANALDRHELGHAVLEQFRSADADPPSLLYQGWAEWAEDSWPETLPRYLARRQSAQRALQTLEQLRDRSQLLSLEELVDVHWYHRHDGPVYVQGGPFVAFLLREYGVERFLDLYNTCRPQTFESDCRRILGVDLETLDELLWRNTEAVATFQKFYGDRPSEVELTEVLIKAVTAYPSSDLENEEFLRRLGSIDVVAEAVDALDYNPPTLSLIGLLKDQHPSVRARAARALAWFPVEAEDALPVLVDLLEDENYLVWRWAGNALAEMGPRAKEAVPAMIRLLIREEDKQGLAYMLGSIGSDAKPAVPELLKLLNHEGRVVRVTAAYALWKIDGQFDVVLPVFVEALLSSHPYPAVTFLGEIGPAAKAAAPEIARLLVDDDVGVRAAAAEALKRIDPEQSAKLGLQ